jgi:hypothetical protein
MRVPCSTTVQESHRNRQRVFHSVFSSSTYVPRGRDIALQTPASRPQNSHYDAKHSSRLDVHDAGAQELKKEGQSLSFGMVKVPGVPVVSDPEEVRREGYRMQSFRTVAMHFDVGGQSGETYSEACSR